MDFLTLSAHSNKVGKCSCVKVIFSQCLLYLFSEITFACLGLNEEKDTINHKVLHLQRNNWMSNAVYL